LERIRQGLDRRGLNHLAQVVADEDDVDAAESDLDDAGKRVDGDPIIAKLTIVNVTEHRGDMEWIDGSLGWVHLNGWTYLAALPYFRSCLAPFLHAASATSA